MSISLGERPVLTFVDTSLLGAGVAKLDGMAIFCPGAVAGDVAEVEITEVKRRYANSRLRRILSPSPKRTEVDCPAFGSCGSCLFRHLDYREEARVKEDAVRAMLRRLGADDVLEPIVTADPQCYRNKVVFHLEPGRYGYYAPGSHRLIYPTDGRCRLHPPIFDEIARWSVEKLHDFDTAAAFTALMLRRSVKNECTAVLFANTASDIYAQTARAWAHGLRERFPFISGAFLGTGEPGGNTSLQLLAGDAYLTDTFLSLNMQISPAAFYQVNHEVAEKLCRTAAEFAALQPGETAADLYCGTGIIGMTAAALSPDASVIGIEINESAVRDALANAKCNRLRNIRFHCGDSAAVELENTRFDCVIIDPPRKGCAPEMLAALTRLDPARIVYVSCNPATLSRDLTALTKSGWTLIRARPFDMFPRTGHVETVCLLSKLQNRQHIEIELNMDELDVTIEKKLGNILG